MYGQSKSAERLTKTKLLADNLNGVECSCCHRGHADYVLQLLECCLVNVRCVFQNDLLTSWVCGGFVDQWEPGEESYSKEGFLSHSSDTGLSMTSTCQSKWCHAREFLRLIPSFRNVPVNGKHQETAYGEKLAMELLFLPGEHDCSDEEFLSSLLLTTTPHQRSNVLR